MSTKDRRDRERMETREKILDAARHLFARDGYEAVTMRAIAEEAEYTPTAIYHHFENKQTLVTELCHYELEGFGKRFASAVPVTDPVERIRVIGQSYLEFAVQNPNHYRFMFMTVLPQIEHTPEYLAERCGNPEHDAYAVLAQACRDVIAGGRVRAEFVDADQLAQMFWGALHGLASLRIVKAHDEWIPWRDLHETAQRQMDALLHGVLK